MYTCLSDCINIVSHSNMVCLLSYPDGVNAILVSDFESRFNFSVDLPTPDDWIEGQRRTFPSEKQQKRPRAGEL